MLATNVKQVVNPEIISKIYEPTLSQKTNNTTETNVVNLQKQPNCSRMFEAFNDCV